ncbi:hypothetical protein D0T49_05000 [Paludibacter sp. 221]|uniref:hypothetical protein n=1 Tax=Paludibacter sp. 221 TaxID=2302939 RepID=UPI0013D6D9E4|nr:hypothetical protein [Paludibacter sp. 221]NDV46397.1 hypothetical protein [Paludibacter sp. 221]
MKQPLRWKNTIGFGILWQATKSVRIQAYYDIVDFENTANVAGVDAKEANVFSLRLQYRF